MWRTRHKRTQRALAGSASIIVSRFFSLICGLLTTGILARYFTPEQFGLWAILTFLIGVIPVLDIGIGLALRNKLSALYSDRQNHNESGRIYFFSVFYAYIYLSLILAVLLCFAYYIIPWGMMLNTTDPQIIQEGSFSYIAALIILVLSLPFGVSLSGFFSRQETHWNSFFETLKSILAIIFIVSLVVLHARFTVIVVWFSIAMLIPVIISFFTFLRKCRWKFTVPKAKDLLLKIKELIPESIQFGLMQFSATLMFSTQALIVGKTSGLKDAGEYALVQKLFLILNILHFAILSPLWSAYTEAVASRDIKWVKKMLVYSVVYTVGLFTIGSLGLYVFGKQIIFLWTGKTIANVLLYALMGIWAFIAGWVSCFSVYLNGIGKLKLQTIWLVLTASIYIPLSLHLGEKFGVIGICMSNIVVSIPLAISTPIQSFMSFKNFNRITRENE
jgi:O-antigen/teichoic acid export membrane protein